MAGALALGVGCLAASYSSSIIRASLVVESACPEHNLRPCCDTVLCGILHEKIFMQSLSPLCLSVDQINPPFSVKPLSISNSQTPPSLPPSLSPTRLLKR